MAEIKKPFVLLILDGWGFSEKLVGNPLKKANLPNLTNIDAQFPMVLLQASGPAVGMSWGETGNSEVGHLALGAGRIVDQYHLRINRAINNNKFFSNPALLGIFKEASTQHSTVHLVGLLTSNTVHAAFEHVVALLKLAAQNQQPAVRLHLFLDGRDSGLQEAPALLNKLTEEIKKIGAGVITTLIGRDSGMDRDNNWEKTQAAFELIAQGKGEIANDMVTTINSHYQKGLTDSNMPALLVDTTYTGLREHDAIIFFNFREDSMRQLFQAFTDTEFSLFPRPPLTILAIASMTQYMDGQHPAVAFPPPQIKNGLSEYLAEQAKSQLHIAETDKYAHVTFFFNGLINQAIPSETDVFINSVKNIEQEPAMASALIAAKVCEEIDRNVYDFILANIANADLLAHTGNFDAVVTGAEATDTALGQIAAKVLEKDGILLITADHGNAESLFQRSSDTIETKHNDSPVFCYLVGKIYQTVISVERAAQRRSQMIGILPDVAPTILELMNLPKPPEMTGQSLLPALLKNQ